ncbi:MAG: metal ABC transporter ATP-binding protein [Pseudomonadota bacterium]
MVPDKTSTSKISADMAVMFENVTIERGGISILDRVTASVPRGGCTAIIGPNGAGKTTLLLALLGEMSYRGRIHTACNVTGGCSRIGYVPQRLIFDRGLPITVTEFMAMGIQKRPMWFGVRSDLKRKALALLTAVKADHLAERKLGALSGGEMQRVLLALALQQEPELLVLDEPASGVDFQGEHVFCELLDGLRKENGFTQLMVSHDLATVTHHATHVICLNRKVAAEGPPRLTLTQATLTAIFGMHMGLVDSRAMPDGRAACSASCCEEKRNA